MTTNDLPRYEWRYMPLAGHMDDDENFRGLALRYQIALLLVSESEESVMLQMYNPNPDVTPEKQSALNTDLLSTTLRSALAKPGGSLQALAALRLFLHQVQTAATPREKHVLEMEPPHFDDQVIDDILAPGLGWLVWRWQFESLAVATGCSARLAKELAGCWNLNFPRTKELLGALSINRWNMLSIVEMASRWNGSGGYCSNMIFPRELLACLEQHKRLRFQKANIKEPQPMNELNVVKNAFQSAWHVVTDTYRSGAVNSECTLHSLMYAELRKLLGGHAILCEPRIAIDREGSFVPDIIVVKDDVVVAVAEFKFVPHGYPVYEMDLRKLSVIAEHRPSFDAFLDPMTGKYLKSSVRTSEDCLLVFGVIGNKDAVAVDEDKLKKSMGSYEPRFQPLILKVPEDV